jgi:regulator of protease activity HflC (stomatin/prohibitin superfamily)
MIKAILVNLVVLGVAVLLGIGGIHHVQEGHVGVYWIGGALLKSITDPGINWMMPVITTFANVQVTLQTDTVVNIPCGTSGGSVIYFDKIEVVNRLRKESAHETIKLYGVNYDRTWIFDRIHHEINQFCSSHTLQEVYIDKFETLDEALATSLQTICDKFNTGIQIVSIRVTKPRIPDSVKKNYEAIETAKTDLLVREQQENVARTEESTAKMRAVNLAQREAEVARIQAEKELSVAKINVDREIIEKEAEKKKRFIDDEIQLHQLQSQGDAEFYRITKTAEANKETFTEKYLRYILYKSLSNNTTIYFGEKIPQILLDKQSPLVFSTPNAKSP